MKKSSLSKTKPAAKSSTTTDEKVKKLYGGNQTKPAVPIAHRKVERVKNPVARRVAAKSTQAK